MSRNRRPIATHSHIGVDFYFQLPCPSDVMAISIASGSTRHHYCGFSLVLVTFSSVFLGQLARPSIKVAVSRVLFYLHSKYLDRFAFLCLGWTVSYHASSRNTIWAGFSSSYTYAIITGHAIVPGNVLLYRWMRRGISRKP